MHKSLLSILLSQRWLDHSAAEWPFRIRAMLANHENANGLFVTPVPVTVTGALFWDGEHRFPNTVGPEGLQPGKAWEIHPIKQLAER